MPERQSRHSDNETIDEMQDDARRDAHQGSAGGNLHRTVGSRAELHEAEGTLEGEEIERTLGDDDPDADAMKGNKTFEKIRTGKQNG
jgi:hypothetical protein